MTELHIDSKSHKFDRRHVLKGVAALPLVTIPDAAVADEDPSLRLWDAFEAQELIECDAIDKLDTAKFQLPPDHIKHWPAKVYRHEQLDNYYRANFHISKEKVEAHHKALDDALAKRAKAERDLDIAGLTATYEAERAKTDALFSQYLDCDPTTPEGLARKVEELFWLGDSWNPDERRADFIKRLPSFVRGMV